MKIVRPFLVLAALAATAAAPAFADNLILNGSFETGDLTSWTTNNTNFTYVESSGFDGYAPEDGNYFLAMGNVGSDATISQTFADTVGSTYQLSYYYASNGTGYSDFSAAIDGTPFPASVFSGYPNSGDAYDLYTFEFVGTGSDTLTFTERNDPAYDALDNVSVSTFTAVTATPEPSSLVLLGTGVLSLAGAARRKFRK